jgi:hypothetical protein
MKNRWKYKVFEYICEVAIENVYEKVSHLWGLDWKSVCESVKLWDLNWKYVRKNVTFVRILLKNV